MTPEETSALASVNSLCETYLKIIAFYEKRDRDYCLAVRDLSDELEETKAELRDYKIRLDLALDAINLI